MTDDEVKLCINNAVSDFEYRSWATWYNRQTDGYIPSTIKENIYGYR
jgi:hypothetical protein